MIKYYIVINILIVSSINCVRKFDSKWEATQIKYKLNFNDDSFENKAYTNYETNLERIEKFNSMKNCTYKLGENKFTSENITEIRAKILLKPMKVPKMLRRSNLARTVKASSSLTVPDNVDWTHLFGPVRDQGTCGSCYTFATVGVMEAKYAMKTNGSIKMSLSEEQLLDCTGQNTVYENFGCNGGSVWSCLLYAKAVGMLNSDNYPYQGVYSRCPKTTITNTRNRFKIAGVTRATNGMIVDENALKEYIATKGPVSVYIDATTNFLQYKTGVFYDLSCSETEINHAIILVGYGTDQETGLDYWLIRNSWGRSWGMNGYAKMARNKDNNCLIASYPYDAIL